MFACTYLSSPFAFVFLPTTVNAGREGERLQQKFYKCILYNVLMNMLKFSLFGIPHFHFFSQVDENSG